jgi:Spy/CpxP family protein refolding chaperone
MQTITLFIFGEWYMKKLTFVAGLFLLGLSLTTAQESINQPARGAKVRERLLRALNLTDDQKKNFESLLLDMRRKAIEQQAHIKTARLDLAELFKAEQPNQTAIQNKIGEITQLQSQQRLLRVDHWFAVNKRLTAAQQKIWKKASARFLAQQKARMIRGRAAQVMRNQRNLRRFAQPGRPMDR